MDIIRGRGGGGRWWWGWLKNAREKDDSLGTQKNARGGTRKRTRSCQHYKCPLHPSFKIYRSWPGLTSFTSFLTTLTQCLYLTLRNVYLILSVAVLGWVTRNRLRLRVWCIGNYWRGLWAISSIEACGRQDWARGESGLQCGCSGALRGSLGSFGAGMALHNCLELRQGG